MKIQIFAYKGVLGLIFPEDESQIEGRLFNPDIPEEINQQGYIVDAKSLDISKEAFEILKSAKPSKDGAMDCYAGKVTEDSEELILVSFCKPEWPRIALREVLVYGDEEIQADFSLLEPYVKPEIKAPEDFIQLIDSSEKNNAST